MAEGIRGRQTGFPSARELSIALAGRAEDVCRHYLPGGRKERRYWRCGDVTGAPGGSLWVHLAGPRVGKWVDAATQERGDLLDLIRVSRNHPTLRSVMDVLHTSLY